MGFATLLGFLYATGRLGVTPILLIAFLTGLTQSQSAPTYQAVITTLVPSERIQSAVALNSLQFNLSRVLGPALAGILLAYAGAGWCFAVNAVSFLAVIISLWRIEIPSPAERKEGLVQSLGSGLRHVRESPVLLALIGTAAAGSFLAYPLVTYLPVLAGDVLGSGAKGYGQLMSGFGLGAIAGALVTAHRGSGRGRGRRLLLAFAAYGGLILGVALSRSQLLSVALLAAAGWSLVTAFSTLNSLVQENVPDALRGRVVGIYGLAFRGGMPLGSLLAGFLVAPFGAPLTIGAFGVVLALLAGGVVLRGRTVPAL